jgi:hypothetical protein
MADLDTVPMRKDVAAYAGDTLTLKVVAPATLVGGMTWAAQVRSAPGAPDIDATFSIIEPTVANGPAYLTLSSAQTSGLFARRATSVRKMVDGRAVETVAYTGVWDCQVSDNGADPVRTLVRGMLTLELDVTRVTP